MAFLEFAHIHKEFGGAVAVKEFNLEVAQGEFISLLGPSGCGKTTMLRIVAGFEKPSSGQIMVGGQDVTNAPPNKRKMGMVFQNYALFPHMTAAGNVGYGLRVSGTPKAEVDRRVQEMLDLVQLNQFGGRYPYQLSGGQQQRVALARALAIQPKLLLLDEPLSALDAKVRAEVREEIRRIQTQLGITTIFVTHDQEEAMSVSDRVVVMSRGQIEQVGKPFEIYNYPKTAFVASFVGTLNQLPCVVGNAAAGQVLYNDQVMTTPTPIEQPTGSPVVLMLRPEELRLGGDGQNKISALVNSVSFQGSVVRVRLKPTAGANGHSLLTVDLFNERSLKLPEVGQTHTISFPPQACWVMPAGEGGVNVPHWKDKALFTPGPLTTSPTVKQAMLRDLGSRDFEFIAVVQDIRQRLLALGTAQTADYTAVLLPGSGTYSVEAMLSTSVPPEGKLLIISNGAYGRRLEQIARVHHLPARVLSYPEDCPANAADVDAALADDPAVTHVALVHCETTSGLLNPAREIGAVARQHNQVYCVDAMSSFGAVPLDLAEWGIDYLVSSANKCIEGVPGFGFVLARRSRLAATAGLARTLSLDLHAQWQGLEQDGQFRFTPPTHALLAFQQALRELEAEGGVAGRAARYQQNHATLLAGMRALGFVEYLAPEHQSTIITSFRYPTHPNFDFAEFYQRLNDQGYVIYPGKVTNADCFRIGHIGRLAPSDMRDLLRAIGAVLDELSIQLR